MSDRNQGRHSLFQHVASALAVTVGLSATAPPLNANRFPKQPKLEMAPLNAEYLTDFEILLKSKFGTFSDTDDPKKILLVIATPGDTPLSTIKITGIQYRSEDRSFRISTSGSDRDVVINVDVDGFSSVEIRQAYMKDGKLVMGPEDGRTFEITRPDVKKGVPSNESSTDRQP